MTTSEQAEAALDAIINDGSREILNDDGSRVGVSKAALDDLIAYALTRLSEIEPMIQEAAKRSNYVWSEGGEYTADDWKNEGAISLAKRIAKIGGV